MGFRLISLALRKSWELRKFILLSRQSNGGLNNLEEFILFE